MAEGIGQALGQPQFVFTSAGLEPKPSGRGDGQFPQGEGHRPSRHTGEASNRFRTWTITSRRRPREGGEKALPPQPTKTVCFDWSVEDPSTAEGRRPTCEPLTSGPTSFSTRTFKTWPKPCSGTTSINPNRRTQHNKTKETMIKNTTLSCGIRLGAVATLAAGFALGGVTSDAGRRKRKPSKTSARTRWSTSPRPGPRHYAKVDPDVSVEVSAAAPASASPRSSTARATSPIPAAHSKRRKSRRPKPSTGKEPKEFMVGYDALAVYVHKDNPLNEI